MTAKSIYEAALTELNKLQAPSITLEDFNHFFNKAINQYINRKYNIYDVNQQSSDDLRVLKSTTMLSPKKAVAYNSEDDIDILNRIYGATYEVNLPDDYLHMLNCICVYKVNSTHKCYDPGNYIQFGATRLTADAWGNIINNFYMKPSYKRPYYYIHNVNTQENVSTNPIILDENGQITSGTDFQKKTKNPDDSPSSSTTQYVYHCTPLNIDETSGITSFIKPIDYVFNETNVDTMNKNLVTDDIKVELDGALTYLLVLPINVEVKSITSEIVGDQTILYTDRKYLVDRSVTVGGKPYKLIFLGRGSKMSGNYTIKLYE